MHGIVDEKTDVFAFGVLLLEIITGRQALDESQPETSLILWVISSCLDKKVVQIIVTYNYCLQLQARPLMKENDVLTLVDKTLVDSYNPEEMDCAVLAASFCIQENPVFRPRMNQASIPSVHKCCIYIYNVCIYVLFSLVCRL